MVAKALKQAKQFENSSKTSDTNAGSLRYNATGAGAQSASNKAEGDHPQDDKHQHHNIESRTVSTGDFYQDVSKKLNIKREREKNVSQDITSI